MSFSLTVKAFKNRTKTVTRRLGWGFLRRGDKVMGIEKGMGLKKGEKIVRLAPIEVLSIRREPLHKMTWEDLPREGFPEMTRAGFVLMFAKHNKCKVTQIINRIEFKYL